MKPLIKVGSFIDRFGENGDVGVPLDCAGCSQTCAVNGVSAAESYLSSDTLITGRLFMEVSSFPSGTPAERRATLSGYETGVISISKESGEPFRIAVSGLKSYTMDIVRQMRERGQCIALRARKM